MLPDKFLRHALIYPLVGTSILFLLLAIWLPWQGFLVNLSSTLLGSVVTVAFVDVVLKRNRDSAWRDARLEINRRIDYYCNSIAMAIRLALRVPSSVVKMEQIMTIETSRREARRIIEDHLLPSLQIGLETHMIDWKTLDKNLHEIHNSADRIISLFSLHLSPAVLRLVLAIQNGAWSIICHFETWPDVLTKPSSSLSGSAKDQLAKVHKEFLDRDVTKHLNQMLADTDSLIHILSECGSG